jgi:hypothetical protein
MQRLYRAPKAPSQPHFLYVYDGRQYVGQVAEHDDKVFVAYSADDRKLGTFKSILLASRAIPSVAAP